MLTSNPCKGIMRGTWCFVILYVRLFVSSIDLFLGKRLDVFPCLAKSA